MRKDEVGENGVEDAFCEWQSGGLGGREPRHTLRPGELKHSSGGIRATNSAVGRQGNRCHQRRRARALADIERHASGGNEVKIKRCINEVRRRAPHCRVGPFSIG